MKNIKKYLIGLIVSLAVMGGIYSSVDTEMLGAQPILTSSQIGTSSASGFVLQTDGFASEWVATSTLGISGGSGSQTPWISNIDGGGYNLTNVDYITATGTNATSTFTAISIGTTTHAYALNVDGAIQTDTAFYGDYWISASGNSMAIQPTGDTDDFLSFKTVADRPTIKREGGKFIYFNSSNVYDVGISLRDDDTYSGTLNYEKDNHLMSMLGKASPLGFKANSDYDDYIKIQTVNNIPELTVASSSGFKINAGGTNSLLLNHSGGNIGFGTSSTAYPFDFYGNARIDGTLTLGNALPVGSGGTGATTLTDHGVLVGSGTAATTPLAVGTNGQLLIGSTGADPVFATLNCDNALTCTTGAGTLEIDVDDSFLLNTGDVGTGIYDFGGATSVEIPNSTNPTVDASGEVAINTTAASSSIRYYDGTAERAIYPWGFGGLSYASSTLSYIGSYGAAGTTTILVFNAPIGMTLTDMYCKTDQGTATIHFEDGTNDTDSLRCGPNGVEDDGTIANNTWTKWEDFKVSIGTQTGDPNVITITPVIRKNAD